MERPQGIIDILIKKPTMGNYGSSNKDIIGRAIIRVKKGIEIWSEIQMFISKFFQTFII